MLPWFTKYPNQNDEILNLDWVIKQVENLKAAYEAFLAANSLTFADPIMWDITKQYSKNTIVLSPEGDAYLSKKVVGDGIQLNNTDYWLEIFNFADYVRTANYNLTMHIEQNTTRATAAYDVDDWLLWDDILYKVITAIAIDDLLVVGTNIVHFTVEDFCRAWQTYMINTIVQYKNAIDDSELQYKNDIDASELAYRNQLAGDIANTTASLQAQLNLAIAGVTVDSEVINARLGADGVTYDTLGDAIRTQVTNLLLTDINSKRDFSVETDVIFEKHYVAEDSTGFASGSIKNTEIGETIDFNTASNMSHYYIEVSEGEIYKVRQRMRSGSQEFQIAFTDDNDVIITLENRGTGSLVTLENSFTVPAGATKLYVATQSNQAPSISNSTSCIWKQIINNEINNLCNQNFSDGYWNDSMTATTGTGQQYRSFKMTLPAGVYTLTCEGNANYIRENVYGTMIKTTIKRFAGESLRFYVPSEREVGFSFNLMDEDGVKVNWKYTRFYLEKGEISLDLIDKSFLDLNATKSLLGKADVYYSDVKMSDLMNGYYTSGVYTTGSTRLTSINRFRVNKGDFAVILSKNYAIAFIGFDGSNNYIKSSPYISPTYISPSAKQSYIYQFDYDGYVTFNMYDLEEAGEDLNPRDYDNIVRFVHMPDIFENISVFFNRATMSPLKVNSSLLEINGQGGCIVDNELWSFSDGVSDGTIKRINLDTMTQLTEKTHELGHANSVDYSISTSTLITFGSNGANQPTIVLYTHPELQNDLQLTDPDCVVIPLYDGNGHMNVSGSVCFGESRNIAYFIEGVYSDASQTINQERKIYKILLGMGDNDLSSDGYGTYISGSTGAQYNGTAKILSEYTGLIIAGASYISEGNSLPTPQDIKYNGNLYVTYGTYGNNVMVISLNDNSKTYKVVNNYTYKLMDYDGAIFATEPEMFAIYKDMLLFGINNRQNNTPVLLIGKTPL